MARDGDLLRTQISRGVYWVFQTGTLPRPDP